MGHALPSVAPSPRPSQATGVASITAPPASPSPPEVTLGRLPVTSRDLFGRESELAWLDECWEKGVHVASVIAWGGVGKSALVNAWLVRLRDRGWDGAVKVFGWSFYSQGTDRLSSSDEFVDVALRWFGDEEPTAGSPWDKGERLAALVSKQQAILVLDGVEPLQWGPGLERGKFKDPALQALVKELGAQNKGLCLITSRLPLTDLEALSGGKVQEQVLEQLSDGAGADLLKARGAKGSDGELQAAAKEYEGHSLALTLLGAYLRKAHKGDVRKRTHIPLAEKPAHRMMATYERWFAGKPELAILRMLGLFDRPAPEDEIAAVRAKPVIRGLTNALARLPTSAWNQAVTALRDVGLLAGDTEAEESERLDAHPLVREYFGEQLKREQPAAFREGHRRLYEHLKRKAKTLPDTIEEMAPLYAAVVHGCQAGKNQEACDEILRARIRRGNDQFSMYKLAAFGSEVAALSAFFEPPWGRMAHGLSESNQAWILSGAGFALRALGRLQEAAALMRSGLSQHVKQKNWMYAAKTASNLSELLQARGELREAWDLADRSVELAQGNHDALQGAFRMGRLAAVLHAMGRRDEAAMTFKEAERIRAATAPHHPVLYSLPGFEYCDFLLDQGRDAEVRDRANAHIVYRTPYDSLLDIALDQLALGRAHLLAVQRGDSSDLPQATSHLQQAVDGFRHAGQQDFLPLALLARAALHTHTRAFPLARKDLDEALAIATRCGFRLHECDAHLGLARLALAEGDPASARPHFDRARDLVTATGYHRRDGEIADLTRALAEASPPG